MSPVAVVPSEMTPPTVKRIVVAPPVVTVQVVPAACRETVAVPRLSELLVPAKAKSEFQMSALLVKVTMAPLVLLMVPLLMVNVPVPSAEALFRFRVPAFRMTPSRGNHWSWCRQSQSACAVLDNRQGTAAGAVGDGAVETGGRGRTDDVDSERGGGGVRILDGHRTRAAAGQARDRDGIAVEGKNLGETVARERDRFDADWMS